jgi:O-antigen/teichoic acid export membrane protein
LEQVKNKSAFTNASIYLIASIISFAISIFSLPIYTRLLTPSDFGISLIFVMLGKIVVGFVTFNLHFSTYRYYFELKDKVQEFRILNSTSLLFLVIVFLITLFVSIFTFPLYNAFLFDGKLKRDFVLLSISSGFLDYFVIYFTTLLTAELKSIQFAAITIANIVLNTLFSIYFIIEYNLTYMGRVFGILFSQVIILIVLLAVCKNTLSLRFSFAHLKKSIRLTLPMIPQMGLGLSQNYLDKTILSYFKGAAALGNYSLGINFATVLKTIMDAVEKAWSPFFFKKGLENTPESKKAIVENFFSLAFIYMIIGLGIIYFSEEAIRILTTKAYFSAMYVVPVYVYFYLFAIFGYLSNAQLTIAEKIKFILPGAFASAITNILLNLILISQFGSIGAAISVAITGLISQIFLFYYGMKFFPLPLNWKKIIWMYVILILFTIPFYPLAYFDINFILKVLIKFILIALFFCVGLWYNFISSDLIISFSQNNKVLKLILPKNFKTV